MSGPAARDESHRGRTGWLAAAFALSATAAFPDIVRQTFERPESVHVWLAPILVATEVFRGRSAAGPPRPGLGTAGTLGAFVALMLGVVGGSPTLAWAGLSLGCIALAVHAGWPSLAVMAPLLAWAPLPLALPLAFSPDLEAAWATGITALLHAFGSDVECLGSLFTTARGAKIEFSGVDDGFILAHGYAMLGAWWATRNGARGRAWFGQVAAFGLTGFMLQGAVLIAAVLRLITSDAHAGRMALRHGPSCVVAAGLCVLLLVSLQKRARQKPGEPNAEPVRRRD